MKKFLAVFLSAVIACTGMCINANAGGEKKKETGLFSSKAAVQTVQSGGNDIIWNYSVFNGNAAITGFDEEMYGLMNPDYYNDSVLYLPKEINGKKVVRIEDYAFAVNDDNKPYSFRKIIIPNTVSSIGGGAFYYNTQLEEVELEEGSVLEKIEFHHDVELHFCTRINASDGAAFMGCNNLKRIGIGDTDMLPESLHDIEFLSFLHCVSLESVDLSKCKLTQINGSVFYNCNSLSNVKFPRNLNSIGDGAFAYCESLKELSFPATLETIGESYEDPAFVGCKSLERIRFETFEVGSNRGRCSLSFLARGTFAFCEKLTDVQLAESIYGFNISESCFQNTGLRSIDIPSCVTKIEDEAFAETKLANEAHTKNGDAYSVGIFGNPTISTSVFGNTYDNISPDEVPKIAGRGTDSNAYAFTVKQFGPEFFVDLDGYNPFHYPHTIETIPRQEPTCMDYGLTEIEYCTECGKILKYGELIPKADHTPETIPGKAATCTQEGLTAGERCSVCGEILKKQTKLPKTDHNYVNGVCTVCGEEQPAKQIMIGDIDGDGSITSADALAILRYSVGLSSESEVGKTYNVK